MLRFAVAGLRHGHITALIQHVNDHPDCEVVAIAEEDAASRDATDLDVTHESNSDMIQNVDCDVIAIGDAYGRRGAIAIEALKAGKHVMSDKPLCTRLSELDEIESLLKGSENRLGLMLDLRNAGVFIALRDCVQKGEIGDVETIHINGMHPPMYGTRPSWYFEKDMHGGTLNDIVIHATDLIPWMTGQAWKDNLFAKSWHSAPDEVPHFLNAGQAVASLDSGATVMIDMSYFVPNSSSYGTPVYWRTTVFGSTGMAEVAYNQDHVAVITADSGETQKRPVADARSGGYLQDFIDDINGASSENATTTATNLTASRVALQMQTYSEQEQSAGPLNA